MKKGRESKSLAEKEVKTQFIVVGDNHVDAKEKDMLIQLNECPECGEGPHLTLTTENGAGQSLNIQIPTYAMYEILKETDF